MPGSKTEKQKHSSKGEHDETAEARSDRDGNKPIGIGYGQDAGLQGGENSTAGGREGQFSLKDSESSDEDADSQWSPGSSQPRS